MKLSTSEFLIILFFGLLIFLNFKESPPKTYKQCVIKYMINMPIQMKFEVENYCKTLPIKESPNSIPQQP